MTDKIFVLDGSRDMHVNNTLCVLGEIQELRPIDVNVSYDSNFLDKYIARSLLPTGQVDVRALVGNLMRNDFFANEKYSEGKIILLDHDLASPEENVDWGFGTRFPFDNSLGYVVASTHRAEDEAHFRDILRHEIGHMFGAPSKSRANLEYTLGPHCRNQGCVMQQKVSVEDGINYARMRERMNLPAYCQQCSRDIRGFSVR